MDISPTPAAIAQSENIAANTQAFPLVSVIIPTYNNAVGLRQVLSMLQQQRYPAERLDIIVVDNNSTDGSDHVALEMAGVRVVYEKEIQNAAASRNRGIAAAIADILAFTDSDCLPTPDWIVNGVKALTMQAIDGVAGEIIVSPISLNSPAVAMLDALYYFNQQKVVSHYGAAITANFITRRQFFDRVGAFNSHFDELEDLELGMRAKAIGAKIQYVADCVIVHPPRTTLASLWKVSWRYGKGIFSVCQQNPKWAGRWGWRHPFRVMRMLIQPRDLCWERLPFPIATISWQKRFWIYLLLWWVVQLPEAVGYVQEGLKPRLVALK